MEIRNNLVSYGSVNLELIDKCKSDIAEYSISDKHNYMLDMVVRRLDKCNQTYLDKFDSELDRLLKSADSEDMTELLKYSVNLYNNVVTECLKTLSRLVQ